MQRLRAWVGLVAAAALSIAGCSVAGTPAPTYPVTDIVSTTIHSTLLGRDLTALVFRPHGYDAARSYPVVYLLHGYGADPASWLGGADGIRLDGMAQQLIDGGRLCPVVLVAPDIDNSYGVDSAPAADQFDHGPYGRYLIQELMPAIEAEYPPAGDADGRFIAGYSMGGFGALQAFLQRPFLFAGAGALSPAMFIETPADRQWLFNGVPGKADPMLLVRDAPIERQALFLGYGTNDYGWIRDGTREFARRLSGRGFEATPLVVEGGHDVDTWRQLAPRMLLTLLAQVCVTAPPVGYLP
jgi:enterochelin esterase-like enzyme